MELPSTEKLARSLKFEDDSKTALLKELEELEQLLAKRLELSLQEKTPSGMHDQAGHAASMDGKVLNGHLVRKACMHEASIQGATLALEAREAESKLEEVKAAPPAVHQPPVSQSLST